EGGRRLSQVILAKRNQECRIVGWAKAVARAFIHGQAYRAPCPRVVVRSASICNAWARRTRGFDIWSRSATAFAHPTKLHEHFGKTNPSAAMGALKQFWRTRTQRTK